LDEGIIAITSFIYISYISVQTRNKPGISRYKSGNFGEKKGKFGTLTVISTVILTGAAEGWTKGSGCHGLVRQAVPRCGRKTRLGGPNRGAQRLSRLFGEELSAFNMDGQRAAP
jgi:hypothetical protein